ncbi:transcriptional regulator [Microbacterium mangrovi]|uniref:Transcriptional regulator n=1 Tax=Microbacterium mangrovi TaxID=1348253 RepID=A0A0B2A8P3_9MICO|nr:LCP family protein [Microbacterium mangrovi]KHK99475.1 transcriptional regulator [Microbacterium mangrovi]
MTAASLGLRTQPIRHPDGSEQVMTRRGWWLVLLNFLIPGSAQVLAGNRRLGRFGLVSTLVMWALLIVTVVVSLLSRRTMFDLVTNGFVLLIAEVLLVAYAILWIILTIDTLRLVRLVRVRSWTRLGIPILSIGLLVVASGSALTGASYAQTARDTFGTLFGASGPSQAPSDGYYNIMLLGGDDGQGRTSMRFDSISVVSINAETGAITTTGVPRDLAGFPFAKGSPMRTYYPTVHTGHADPTCGWGPGINQLNTEVVVCGHGASLYPNAKSQGSTPGIEATRDALEGILGIKIQYYVLMNYGGFAQLVDALGGVDITVTERLPIGGGPKYKGQPASEWAKGWIEPGRQHMDGNTAQWYARSRETTSDWDRVKRQAQLEQAIVHQVNATTLLTRFREVASAGQNLFKTDIPEGMLGYLADLGVKSRSEKVQAMQLVPKQGVDQFNPDVAAIQAHLQSLLHPASPSPSK